jgi:hypothetical protein
MACIRLALRPQARSFAFTPFSKKIERLVDDFAVRTVSTYSGIKCPQ